MGIYLNKKKDVRLQGPLGAQPWSGDKVGAARKPVSGNILEGKSP